MFVSVLHLCRVQLRKKHIVIIKHICFVWFIINLPHLLIWGVIGFVAFKVLRKRRAKKQKKIVPPENKE